LRPIPLANVLKYKRVKKMRCPICQNEDEKYFYEKNGQIYCRKCIEFSKKQPPLKVVKKTKDIYYRLDYPLTPN